VIFVETFPGRGKVECGRMGRGESKYYIFDMVQELL
jgi:hypothetical protein